MAKAQIALGLYEGLMGNSGAALSDPTAASYYNPSLLSKKQKDSYSLSGNTLGSYSSKSDDKEVSSFSLNPSYLSTVTVRDNITDEFYIANTSPAKLKIISHENTTDSKTKTELNKDQTQFIFGYTMVFKKIPLGLSFFSQYNQINTVGFSETESLTSNLRSTTSSHAEFKSLGFGISVSGNATFDSYTLGYQFRSRQAALFNKKSGSATSFIHGGTSATDYSTSETSFSENNTEGFGSSFIIGHGFKIGDHEFVTDSQFQEVPELNYTYQLNQSFGYRMNSSFGHQVLCGISHRIGPEVKYFGQSAYYSVGYSWLKNSLRSVIGMYAFESRIGQDVFAAGLTFGSEFNY